MLLKFRYVIKSFTHPYIYIYEIIFDKKEVEDLISDLKKSMEGTDIEDIKNKTKALNEKAMGLASRVYEEAAKQNQANTNNNNENNGPEEAEFVNKD